MMLLVLGILMLIIAAFVGGYAWTLDKKKV